MNRIKELRISNGMTQAELAEQIGINSVTLARYESSDRNPKIDKLEKMSEIFGVSVEYLKGYETKRTENKMLMKRLAELRKELNLSQEELADRLGISLVTMNRYEVGKRVPDADVLTRMAKLFEVSADYLLELSNDKGRGELIRLSKQEYNRLKEIERKYNEIKSLVAD